MLRGVGLPLPNWGGNGVGCPHRPSATSPGELCRGVTLHEDRTRMTKGNTAQVKACLNNLVIGMVLTKTDYVFLPQARRYFNAHTDQAFTIITRLKKTMWHSATVLGFTNQSCHTDSGRVFFGKPTSPFQDLIVVLRPKPDRSW